MQHAKAGLSIACGHGPPIHQTGADLRISPQNDSEKLVHCPISLLHTVALGDHVYTLRLLPLAILSWSYLESSAIFFVW
jgi:hypothetical protein